MHTSTPLSTQVSVPIRPKVTSFTKIDEASVLGSGDSKATKPGDQPVLIEQLKLAVQVIIIIIIIHSLRINIIIISYIIYLYLQIF